MNALRIISIILSIMLYCSCRSTNDCIKVALPKEDLQWFEPYNKGDTVVFACQNTEMRDSFVVISVSNYFTDCNQFEVGNYQYNFAKIGLRPIKMGIVDYHESGIQVEFSNDSQPDNKIPSMKSFLVFDLSVDFKDFKDLSKDTCSIGRKIYSAYHFSNESSISSDFDGKSFEVKSFYWDKKMGLLRYDKGTGEVFELVSD